eukprot:s443_g4.t1
MFDHAMSQPHDVDTPADQSAAAEVPVSGDSPARDMPEASVPSSDAEYAPVPSESPQERDDVEIIDKSPDDVVNQGIFDDPAPATGDSSGSADSSYGPMRRVRMPSKSGPLALHRPLPMKHDDFVEVMREALPHIMDQAIGSLKREAPEAESAPSSKSARMTKQLSVEHLSGTDLSACDALDCLPQLQAGVCHETLIAQYMAKRMQKELPYNNNPKWLQAQIDSAKTAEWNTLADKDAVHLLSPSESECVRKRHAHRIMGSRFVLTKKPLEDIVENGGKADPNEPSHWKVKARWCLQGHLDPDLSSKAREGLLQSPTLSQMGRTVLFQLLSSHKWLLQLGDLKGAFLEADPLDKRYRPLYARLPAGGLPGAEDEQLVEILGNVYGQNDAPAAWYKVFDAEVCSTGFVRSRYDPCLYFLRDNQNRLCGILGSHVDDTVTGGAGPLYQSALAHLKSRFPYRKWRTQEGEFCGAHYRQCPKTFEIEMDQSTFAQNLKPAFLSSGRRNNRQANLDPKEVSVLRALNGSLNWISSQSRPDLSAQVSFSQQSMSCPKVHNLCEANNIIRRAKQHADMKICFKSIPPESFRLVCHSDAAFANVGVYTQAGYVIGFTDASLDGNVPAPWTPAVWKSSRLSRAVSSTLSAEAQSMSNATGTLEWTTLLIAEALDGMFEATRLIF